MAGNEELVVDFLIKNKKNLILNHIGKINKIHNPGTSGKLIDITSSYEVSTEDSGKKADIFINGKGISIKQAGSSFLYNRLQRAEMIKVFTSLGLSNPNKSLLKMDELIKKFQNKEFSTRDRHWSEGFNESDFILLLEFLMMKGSPNLGVSAFPANYILTAPKKNISENNIHLVNFSEYFDKYKNEIFLSLRRQWIGQASNSEHGRACSLANKPNNCPWVFKEIVGTPRTGWKKESEFPPKNRRTVYMIFLTVKPKKNI
jgi:hypothetical protein